MTCPHELSVAAYALGTLDPPERADLTRHLTGCAVCQGRLADVAGVAALLARVPPEVAASTVPVADERVLERVLAAASTDSARRTRRRRLLAAAAAAVVVAGAAGVAAVTAADPQPRPASTVTGAEGRVLAHVRLQPVEEGTDLALRLSGVAPGQHCRLVVVAEDGSRDVVASWEVSYTGAVTISGHTDVDSRRIDRFVVETLDDDTLVEVAVSR